MSRLESVLLSERASATRASPRPAERVDAMGAKGARTPSVAPLTLPLPELQRWFQTVVTHPDGIAAGVAATTIDAPLERIIAPGANISASEAIEIYRYAYRARLIECLADDYPAMAYTLGEARFDALAGGYIELHPSTSPNLNAFGRHMASFCEGADVPGVPAKFLADLARLEWALVEIVHAADDVALAAEALATVPPDRFAGAILLPSATLRVHRFSYEVNAYYQSFKDGEDPTIPAADASATAIYRQGFTLWRMNLTPAMATLLEDLARGLTLGAAIDRMAVVIEEPDELAEAERNVLVWFQSWVRCGFFRAIEIPDALP